MKNLKKWQEEFKKGNLNNEIICGEVLCLLDGSAEKAMKKAFIHCLILGLCILFIGVLVVK
jgi:hypothetical protein